MLSTWQYIDACGQWYKAAAHCSSLAVLNIVLLDNRLFMTQWRKVRGQVVCPPWSTCGKNQHADIPTLPTDTSCTFQESFSPFVTNLKCVYHPYVPTNYPPGLGLYSSVCVPRNSNPDLEHVGYLDADNKLSIVNNHHVAGKDMCVGFLCQGFWGGIKSRQSES